MTDPHFSKTVIYVCTHNQDGAMGIIVNRATTVTLNDLFEQIKLDSSASSLTKKTVHFGGPVQIDRGFILHTPQTEYNATILVNNTLALTTSKDILEATANDNGPEKMLVALGYAGWMPGQLEEEMLRNAWLSLDTNNIHDIHALVFDKPDHEKIDLAMQLMGLNLANLSDVAGHA